MFVSENTTVSLENLERRSTRNNCITSYKSNSSTGSTISQDKRRMESFKNKVSPQAFHNRIDSYKKLSKVTPIEPYLSNMTSSGMIGHIIKHTI